MVAFLYWKAQSRRFVALQSHAMLCACVSFHFLSMLHAYPLWGNATKKIRALTFRLLMLMLLICSQMRTHDWTHNLHRTWWLSLLNDVRQEVPLDAVPPSPYLLLAIDAWKWLHFTQCFDVIHSFLLWIRKFGNAKKRRCTTASRRVNLGSELSNFYRRPKAIGSIELWLICVPRKIIPFMRCHRSSNTSQFPNGAGCHRIQWDYQRKWYEECHEKVVVIVVLHDHLVRSQKTKAGRKKTKNR